MIAFIDDHRGTYGVEPICRVLPIAPSTYHAHVAQRADPALGSARSQRDGMLRAEVRRVHAENFGVYGVRKVWRQLGRVSCTRFFWTPICPRRDRNDDIHHEADRRSFGH